MSPAYNNVLPFVLAALWAAAAAGIVWYCMNAAANITYVTLADGRRRERKLPFLLRVLLPLTPAVAPLFETSGLSRLKSSISRKLASGGFDDVISPKEYLSLAVLTPAVIGTMLVFFLIGLFALSGRPFRGADASRFLALTGAIFVWLCLYPGMWLKKSVALRHRSILRALSFVIDLLTLSVEAGLDFMAATRNIVARRKPDALGEELSRVMLEIQLGTTRRNALKQMAERVNQPDVGSLVTALAQADELGVSIGAILRIQSDQIRMRRFTRAEKLANEAPVKMLFPLVAFIFPAVFLILLGPIILQLLQSGF